MKVFLAADHRGFKLKEDLKSFLNQEGYKVEDMGAFEEDPKDDFPDFAYPAAKKIAVNPETDRGIFICGSGMGMDVVANKVKGVRATVAYSKESTKHAREHDDVNVITLAADVLSFEEVKDMSLIFLNTDLSKEERHRRRLDKINLIEEENFK